MELRDFARAVPRGWPLVAGAVAIAVAVALGAALATGPRYRSTTVLFVSFDAGTGQDVADQRIGSYLALLRGPRIADAVARDVGIPAARVRAELAAARDPGTALLTITATDTSRVRAAKLVASAGASLQAVAAELERPAAKTAITVAQQPVTAPVPRQLPFYAALAALLGLVAGLALVASVQALRDPVTGASGLRRRFGLETVETIAPDDGQSEPFRRLRARLTARAGHGAAMSLLVTGVQRADDGAEACWSLAAAFAETGIRVVVLDADLRTEDPAPATGLTDVLAGRRSIVDVLRTRAPGPVKYVCPGAPPEDPGTLLATPAVGEAVRDLAHMFDVVLVLAPPVLDAADAQQLATLTGGVVVSVRAGRTRASQLDRALEALRSVGADVVGTLVWLQGVRRPARPSKAPTPDEEPTAVHQLRAGRQASLG